GLPAKPPSFPPRRSSDLTLSGAPPNFRPVGRLSQSISPKHTPLLFDISLFMFFSINVKVSHPPYPRATSLWFPASISTHTATVVAYILRRSRMYIPLLIIR